MLLQSELGGSSKVINKEAMYSNKYIDKAVQVDLLIDASYSELKNINSSSSKYVDEWVQATETAVDNSVLSENFQDFEASFSVSIKMAQKYLTILIVEPKFANCFYQPRIPFLNIKILFLHGS